MIQGVHIAKAFVTNYLQLDLPSRLIAFRNAWNVDDENLPEPLEYKNYEPIAIDAWPMVYTVSSSADGFVRIDYDMSGNPQYRVDYSLRTYVWVKDDDSEQCALKRDRLSTVIRSALLDHPALERSDSENCEPLIDESSMNEQFSDLTLIKGERVMAGGYCGYTLSINETITRSDLGEFANLDIEILPLPTPPDPNF
jgi:hypothetical protein